MNKRITTSPPLVFLYGVAVVLMFIFFGYIFATGDVTGGLGGDYAGYQGYDYYGDGSDGWSTFTSE